MNEQQEDRVRGTEVRELRRAVHDLADTVDMLVDQMDQQSNGRGPPEHAQNARKRVQKVKEQTPSPVRPEDEVQPPWEREGYKTKREWMNNR